MLKYLNTIAYQENEGKWSVSDIYDKKKHRIKSSHICDFDKKF